MASGQQEQPARYLARLVGTTGCEILNLGGEVVAWTVNEEWAARIVRLLNEENNEPS